MFFFLKIWFIDFLSIAPNIPLAQLQKLKTLRNLIKVNSFIFNLVYKLVAIV